MSDNAFIYRHSRDFQAVLGRIGARHITTRPTRRAGTARSSASSRRSNASGRTAARGKAPATAPEPEPELSQASSATTTGAGRTARSGPTPDQPRSQRPRVRQLSATRPGALTCGATSAYRRERRIGTLSNKPAHDRQARQLWQRPSDVERRPEDANHSGGDHGDQEGVRRRAACVPRALPR